MFKQRLPGLFDYRYALSAPAESLDDLLGEAMRVVPEPLRKCMPVEVKATVGLHRSGTRRARRSSLRYATASRTRTC